MLSNRKVLLFIRGERPVMDLKYPLQKHPNYKRTADGGRKAYQKNFVHYEKLDIDYEPDLENIEIIEFTEEEHEE
jgi:hypothetical protein